MCKNFTIYSALQSEKMKMFFFLLFVCLFFISLSNTSWWRVENVFHNKQKKNENVMIIKSFPCSLSFFLLQLQRIIENYTRPHFLAKKSPFFVFIKFICFHFISLRSRSVQAVIDLTLKVCTTIADGKEGRTWHFKGARASFP